MKTDADSAAMSVATHRSDEEAGRSGQRERPCRCLAEDVPDRGCERHGMIGRAR